jgi:hypothetical protein
MELHEFLLARVSEDEAVAREAMADDNGSDEGFAGQFEWLTGRSGRAFGLARRFGDAAARLIAHFAVPARVLAECESKRRIVTECGWETVMRHLALPYADHPDYRDEWRP